jgi:hypothetical protein
MKRRRITIAQCIGWTAIVAVNMALVRSFGVRRVFVGGDLIFFALQVGLWCLFRSRGRFRCFSAGFVVPSMAAVLVLLLCPPPLLDRLMISFMMPYTDLADELEVTYLPTSLSGALGNELWDLHLTVIYFVPVFVAAVLGGMIAMWLIPGGLTPARTMNREESTASIG